ncbi:mRNA turnover and ribosome assembly protein [Recurvomyces mirabilis]|nr:mRNA turnover and ribosome assembly protein [Recurvomyces mirabilis]
MPKSKRQRIVHTSVVQKKPSKEKSASLYAAVQAAADIYQHIFVFSVENMRNTYLKDVRQQYGTDGRLFYGKTKVMAKALGKGKEDEYKPGLSGLGKFLEGNVGLLLTNREVQEVLEFFAEYRELDYARAGSKATRTFTVPAGVVYSRAGELAEEDDSPLPHPMEVMVRKWGMPTRLDKGKVVLDQEFTVVEEGREMKSSQTSLLKVFGVAMAEFRVQILAYWGAGSEEVTEVEAGAGVEVMQES